jgi:AcrR family transcriptional regulator
MRTEPTESLRSSRQYDSPIRRRQVADTRERIMAAGCELLHSTSVKDWKALTIRSIARQAGISERTVYRYFRDERELRDAVMHRLEQNAGIDLTGMRLEDVSDVAGHIFGHLASYPPESKPVLDPTLAEARHRLHGALADAVAEVTADWSDAQRTKAAALLDVLWSVASYERLTVDWQLDRDDAIRTISWAIQLVEDAVRSGRRPT